MNTFKHELYQSAKTLFLALILSAGVSYVYAWTGPSAAAPNGNTAAPLNVSATNQVKSGGLGVGAFTANSVTVGATANAAAVTAPKYCIGTSCITSWPSGSTGVGGSGAAGYLTSWTAATTLGNSGLQIHGPYGGSTAGSYYHVGSWGGNGWGPDLLVERARYSDTSNYANSSNSANSSTYANSAGSAGTATYTSNLRQSSCTWVTAPMYQNTTICPVGYYVAGSTFVDSEYYGYKSVSSYCCRP